MTGETEAKASREWRQAPTSRRESPPRQAKVRSQWTGQGRSKLAQGRALAERMEGLRRTWRAKADEFAEHHCDEVAAAYRQASDDVERELCAWDRELLTIEKAAQESGYSPEHLRRLVRQDKLKAERGKGDKSHLLVERGHLPAKTRQIRGGDSRPGSTYNPEEDARDIARSLGGNDG